MSFSARDELLRRALPGHVYSAGAESPTGPARSPGSRGGSRGGNGFVRSGADWVQSDIPLRVEVLEHLFEEHRAAAAAASRSKQLSHALREVQQLREDLLALREEHTALCEVLRERGALSQAEPQARRRLRLGVVMLRELLEVPGLLLSIGSALGVASARLLTAASRSHGAGMRSTLPSLVARLPPSVHIFGGHTVLGSPLPTVERLILRDERWDALPPMSVGRHSSAAATMGGRIYVAGGNSGQQVLNVVESFDCTRGCWEPIPPMPTARHRCAAAVAGGRFCVLGGEGRRAVAVVEGFDPALQEWETLPHMSMERTSCAAASLAGRMYVVGGADSVGHASASAECYDSSSRQWLRLPWMTTAREFCAAAAANGRLFVIGGRLSLWGTLASVECYDPMVGYWVLQSPMPEERSRHAAVVAGGRIYVLGGSDARFEALSAAACFDPLAGRWYSLAPAPTARVACAAAAAWS